MMGADLPAACLSAEPSKLLALPRQPDMAPSTTEVAVKWTLEDGWEAAASSELLGASVLTADELARYTFFTRVRVETRSGTFELERGQDGLAPRLSCAGGKFGSGGHWLVKCVDILLNEDDEEPRIAFRYLYPAHELPASEVESDFDEENELAVGSQVHVTELGFVQGATRVIWNCRSAGQGERITRRVYDEQYGRLGDPVGSAVI